MPTAMSSSDSASANANASGSGSGNQFTTNPNPHAAAPPSSSLSDFVEYVSAKFDLVDKSRHGYIASGQLRGLLEKLGSTPPLDQVGTGIVCAFVFCDFDFDFDFDALT